MLDKYFYILCRDGQVIEVKNKQETFDAVFGAMAQKGIVVLKDYGTILNGVDVSKVLKENEYDNWISTTCPKEYIKDGTWRDGKEKKVIRYEKWKEEELEEKRKMSLEAPEEKELTKEERKALFEKYRPEFMKKSKEMIPPHDPELTANAKTYQDE